MVNRFGTWWPLWAALLLVWTVIAAASAWMNLPRANTMPEDARYLSQMSAAAEAILRGDEAAVEVARKARRDPLVWSPVSRVVYMMNGVALSFPGNTSGEQTALVAAEYRRILREQADGQRWQFLAGMLLLWLLPCCFMVIAVRAYRRHCGNRQAPRLQKVLTYVRQRTVNREAGADNGFNANAVAGKPLSRTPPRETGWQCAV